MLTKYAKATLYGEARPSSTLVSLVPPPPLPYVVLLDTHRGTQKRCAAEHDRPSAKSSLPKTSTVSITTPYSLFVLLDTVTPSTCPL